MRYVNLSDEITEILLSLLTVGFLPTSEHHFDLDLVPLGKEFYYLLAFEENVMFVGSQTYADSLDIDFVLPAFRLLFLLRLLVLEFSVVDEPTDGRLGVRRNLHQVKLP